MVKYVNMTDILSEPRNERTAPDNPANGVGIDAVQLVELLFFAYRDFVSEPDALLADYGFGRAHHRVLHFVNRHPGMRVADLLDILKITKQSLARVLKQLIDGGFISQQTGPTDRRERLLFTTNPGRDLADRLLALQSRRLHDALDKLPADCRLSAAAFLHAIVDPNERRKVAELIDPVGGSAE